MATRHDRAISTFPLAARQTLTNGGTVVGGNGGTYKYDPLTGMATVVRWADGTVPAQDGGTAAAAPVSGAPRQQPDLPGRRTGDGPRTAPDPVPANDPVNGTPGNWGGGAGQTGPGGGVTDAPGTSPGAQSPAAPPVDSAAEAAKLAEDQRQAEKKEAEDRARRDSYARLNAVLSDYGLGSLGATVQQWLIEGLSEAEIVQRMRDTPEFKTRFPAIEARKKKGLSPIAPGEYVAYERQARQMMRAAGIPEGFYDGNDDFQRFLENDLSLAELGDRVTLAANAAFKMPKEARDALTQWGMGPGDLTAFWLDPDKAQPLLERKYAAAQLAGASQRTNYGRLDEDTASRLATLGVSEQQAEQGFGQLANSRELFQSLDRGEDIISQQEQIAGTFEGSASARRRIEQRQRRRQGVFESGGSFASGQTGVSGLGDTSDF